MANRKPAGTGEQETARDKNRQPGSERRDLQKHGPGTKMKTENESIVTVTFNVTVPETVMQVRRSVFITGTLNRVNGKLIDWLADSTQMKQVDNRHWTFTVSGPVGTEIEYKYTLGSWDNVEVDQRCQDTPNRRVTLKTVNNEPLNIEDTVFNWRGVTPCGE